MVLTAGLLLVLTLGFIAAAHWLSGLVNAVPRLSDTVGWLLAPLISLIVATLTFGLLFMFLPPSPLTWRQVRLRSALCGIAWIIGVELLALYASFGEANPYGAIGGVFVVMLWMNYGSVYPARRRGSPARRSIRVVLEASDGRVKSRPRTNCSSRLATTLDSSAP
jgi:membrane protein